VDSRSRLLTFRSTDLPIDAYDRTCAAVVFLNARYQDPALGRFITVDPLVSVTRDAYGYGNNNPITFVDPSGLGTTTSEQIEEASAGSGGHYQSVEAGRISILAHQQQTPGGIIQISSGAQLGKLGATGSTYPLDELVRYVNWALALIDANSPVRAAAFLAQLFQESMDLRYFTELADGSDYNGRANLGNTQPGDGPLFKGRGPIQLTGRSNYTAFSAWYADQFDASLGANYFVEHPEQVASMKFGFAAVVFFWTRGDLNRFADKGDFLGLTRAINGGTNGLADRCRRYVTIAPKLGASASIGGC
jgi:RHS repeat-associated protein